MKKFKGLAVACASLAMGVWLAGSATAAEISGAGATFPYPIYAKWAEAYKQKTGIGLNYQSIGSGGGIKQIKAATVTFGASDMPMKPDDVKSAGLVQFPMIIGGVVPVVNLQGVKPGELVLDGETVARIYLGDIANWSDARIKSLNPKVKLPDQAIAPVYRSDGSGTNFLFSNYLSQRSSGFRDQDRREHFSAVARRDRSQRQRGCRQYDRANVRGDRVRRVCVRQAEQDDVCPHANRDGKVVAPQASAFQAAAANADWAKSDSYYLILTDQAGAQSWPITGASFILMYREAKDPVASGAALKFFAWAYANGAPLAQELDYVPLPAGLVKQVEQTWRSSIMAVWKTALERQVDRSVAWIRNKTGRA